MQTSREAAQVPFHKELLKHHWKKLELLCQFLQVSPRVSYSIVKIQTNIALIKVGGLLEKKYLKFSCLCQPKPSSTEYLHNKLVPNSGYGMGYFQDHPPDSHVNLAVTVTIRNSRLTLTQAMKNTLFSSAHETFFRADQMLGHRTV